ncbi:MAG: hypothetical protein KFW21_00795 [Spirochaetota bacterium]|nr:hypothetical protein [Spirochaetota bacterium]
MVIIYLLILFSSFSLPIFSQEQINKNKDLTTRVGLISSFWYEPANRVGLELGNDWEFMNNKGHGVAVTFPQFNVFYFPNNYIAFSLYPTISYRFVHPKNGFYTSLTMGVGLNIQWKTVPVYNIEGYLIKDSGFYRMIAVAHWDIGYDFEIKYKAPVRLYTSIGWNGIAPNNLGINSHILFQIGLNIKLSDLNNIRKEK